MHTSKQLPGIGVHLTNTDREIAVDIAMDADLELLCMHIRCLRKILHKTVLRNATARVLGHTRGAIVSGGLCEGRCGSLAH